MRSVVAARTAIALMVGGCLLTACNSPAKTTESSSSGLALSEGRTIKDVVLPDLSRAEAPLRERVQVAYSSLQASRERGVGDGELASSFGELGKLLMAAEFLSEAEPALFDAQVLSPADLRWPYYLGHLHRLNNEPAKAIPFFEQVLKLNPEHQAALVWLGQLYVDQGRLDESDRMLRKAVALQPGSAAALFGLGRVALARNQHKEAVTNFEAALVADPQALAVHYPLAMAYRSLGDQRQAEAHLRLWKNSELQPSDPLMDEIGRSLQTALDYTLRGTSALDRKNWKEAIAFFRKGLELSPRDATLHLNLGNALFLADDEREALTHFEEAVRLSPGYARAHFALGVALQGFARDQEAMEQFSLAIKYDPGLVDARFSLAEALRRVGRPEASLEHYQALISADPSASQARFGLAMAFVRLSRYVEARSALEEAVKAHPDQVGFVHALARVLAAAPDDRVRDGRRALDIMQQLRKGFSGVALTETLAMAQAEVGQFDQAATSQRVAIAEAKRMGQANLAKQLAENLALYERRAPCRSPWRKDDLP